MYQPQPWDLSKIRPQDVKSSLANLQQQAKKLEQRRAVLHNDISPPRFLSLLREFEQFKAIASKLGCYVYLRSAENSADQQANADISFVENELAKIGNRLLFFSLWFKGLPNGKAKELIGASGKYHYYLEHIRKTRQFTLKENEEKIINIKDVTGAGALTSVYNILTSQYIFDFAGKQLTQEELTTKVRHPSPKVREQAYRSLFAPYRKHKDVLGEIYKNIVNDWREEHVGLRGYKSPVSVRNIGNDLPEEAVQALLKVCEKNEHVFQRFFELKRKRLGLRRLRRFDIYAPWNGEKEQKIPYDTALRMVLDSYRHFSPCFAQAAESIIQAGHIHSRVVKNKQSGAFCCGVTKGLPPFVLLSYTGQLRDVCTIAHELGHGVHHVLASGQTEFTQQACLPLSETASIFGEMLLTENIQKKDPAKAKELLFYKLDDLYASIIRQAGFVRFELKAHEMMKEGKTIEEMSKVYLMDLRKQLGPKIEVDDIFAYEWTYVPHIFHTPFYCYAYAFGNLLVLALWERYQKEGQPFAEKIIAMLAKGGSESSEEITKALGVDIRSEQFWQQGFEAVERMIKEIE